MADMFPTGLDPHMHFDDILADAAASAVDPLVVEGTALLAELADGIATALEDIERRFVDGNTRIH